VSAVFAFKRALLGLNIATQNSTSLDVTVHLADILGLDLLGLYFLDDSLRDVARYPGMREFLLIEKGWRTLEPDRLRHEQELAARHAERIFAAKAALRSSRSQFRIVSDRISEFFFAQPEASDIVVVAEPQLQMGLATQAFPDVLGAAIQSRASVLLIPRSAKQRRGPVLVIADAPNDPSVAVAAKVAAAAGETLVVVAAYEAKTQKSPNALWTAGIPASVLTIGSRPYDDAQALLEALGPLTESLIVCSRHSASDEGDKLFTTIGQARHVPVLVLEPPADVEAPQRIE
jgi:hypothetical protein